MSSLWRKNTERAIERDGSRIGQQAHPHRRRRLDLRAVARRVSTRTACRRSGRLEYASRKLTSIEINGTYYGSQKPESFAKWHDETPRRFRLCPEGAALRHQPPRAGRSRRVGRALLHRRRAGAEGQAGGRSTGNSRRPRNSIPPISRLSSSCCRNRSKAAPSATRWRSGTIVSNPPTSSRWRARTALPS